MSLSFEGALGPDADVIPPTEDKPASCPITRPLRVLGAQALKTAVADARPTTGHMAVHVEQVSYLVGGDEPDGSVAVEVSLHKQGETNLLIDAHVLDDTGNAVAISKSKIAFIEPAALKKKPRAGQRPSAQAADHLLLSFSAAEIAHYCTVSADDNPIHTDEALVQAYGLEAVTVPGALLLQAAEDQLHKAGLIDLSTRLEVQLTDVVYAQETVSIATRVMRTAAGQAVRFSVLKADGRIALFGAALQSAVRRKNGWQKTGVSGIKRE